MTKSNPYKTTTITRDELLSEIHDCKKNLQIFFDQITQQKNESLVKPLSVELRKLLSPNRRGNDLLVRVETELSIKLSFPDRAKILPPKIGYVTIDEYRNNLIFAIQGRPVTRIDLITMIANEKGAHTDDLIDQMHSISKQVVLPLGNPARDGLFFEQNTTYILNIAKTVIQVINTQIP